MSTKKIEHALPPGTELRNGVYSIERVIGSGGFGITYIGHKKPDTTFGDSKKVVIKELFIAPNTENYNCIRDTYSKKTVRPSESLQNNFEDFKRRFKEEAETLYKFREYEGIVQVLDYFEENGTFYFTMDYIESKDLNEVVKLRGKLSLDEALNYIRQVGSLVHKIHQQKVLHRDIKPQNILIDKNDKAFLIDFGIAKTYNNLDVVSKVSGFHTPGYAPPEQFANKINLISEAMDVHALAATFFYCVTGKNPPTLQDRNLGEDVSVCHINPELPKGIEPIIEKAMAIRPQDRTQTVKEFLDGLAKYGTSAGGTVTEPPPQGNPNPRSSYKWLYYLIVGIALAVAAIMGMRSFGSNEDKPTRLIEYEDGNQYGNKDTNGAMVEQIEQIKLDSILKISEAKRMRSVIETTEQKQEDQGAKNPAQKAADEIASYMVRIPGGTFTMGCTSEQGNDCDNDEKPSHQVTLSSFRINKYEVTQGQWQAIMGNNPSSFKNCNRCAVDNVSWDDVQEFIRKLNSLTRQNYRLPTEAEWEYAARGGQHFKYAGSNNIGSVARYEGNSGLKTHPVGGKSANGYGLFDMSGNVWEWCNDWYGDYSSSSTTNPKGPSAGAFRVNRGGGWFHLASACRVSARFFISQKGSRGDIGFRLAADQ